MKIPTFIHIFNKYLLSIIYFSDTGHTKIRQFFSIQELKIYYCNKIENLE